jgi:hypothetical protein
MAEHTNNNGNFYKITIPIIVGLMMFFAGAFITQLTAARGVDAAVAELKTSDNALKEDNRDLKSMFSDLMQNQTTLINQNTVLIAELKAARR